MFWVFYNWMRFQKGLSSNNNSPGTVIYVAKSSCIMTQIGLWDQLRFGDLYERLDRPTVHLIDKLHV